MPCFSPIDGAVRWLDVGATSTTYALPVGTDYRFSLAGGATMRSASSPAGADILFALGDATITVDADSGILFPAGSLETMALFGRTHIAVMVVTPVEGVDTRLNVTLGTGE
jgi:hypothetical protein